MLYKYLLYCIPFGVLIRKISIHIYYIYIFFWPSSCLNLWMTHGPSTSCSMGPTVSAFIAASVTWGWRSLWECHLSEILSNKWTSKRSCQLSMGSGSMKHWAQHGSEEGTPERNVMRPYSQISLLAKRQHPEYLRKQG